MTPASESHSDGFNPCMACCEHGGICVLTAGHAGSHDTEYCQFSDDQAIDPDVADWMVKAANPTLGPAIVGLQRKLEKLIRREH